MYLTRPVHTPTFLTQYDMGIEYFITRHESRPNWAQYIPFIHGIHLPYAGLNLAALDDALRQHSINAVKSAMDVGIQFPVDRMVMHSMGIRLKDGEILGTYDRMIDSIAELADYAAAKKIILCIENQALHVPNLERFGTFADDWLKIPGDVNRSNVLLTLDSSHAATAAAVLKTAEERFAYLDRFLAKPELIGRVHWSDSCLGTNEAFMKDMHLVPGEGDLPLDFHKKIKALPVLKTLEQTRPEEDMIRGLAFIESL